jgi:putative sterol carrier protein
MTTQELVDDLKGRLHDKTPEQLSQSVGVYQFHLTGEDGADYTLTVEPSGARIEPGSVEHPGVTVTMTATDFKALAAGDLNPMNAFMSGKLTIAGSMGLAMKLSSLIA